MHRSVLLKKSSAGPDRSGSSTSADVPVESLGSISAVSPQTGASLRCEWFERTDARTSTDPYASAAATHSGLELLRRCGQAVLATMRRLADRAEARGTPLHNATDDIRSLNDRLARAHGRNQLDSHNTPERPRDAWEEAADNLEKRWRLGRARTADLLQRCPEVASHKSTPATFPDNTVFCLWWHDEHHVAQLIDRVAALVHERRCVGVTLCFEVVGGSPHKRAMIEQNLNALERESTEEAAEARVLVGLRRRLEGTGVPVDARLIDIADGNPLMELEREDDSAWQAYVDLLKLPSAPSSAMTAAPTSMVPSKVADIIVGSALALAARNDYVAAQLPDLLTTRPGWLNCVVIGVAHAAISRGSHRVTAVLPDWFIRMLPSDEASGLSLGIMDRKCIQLADTGRLEKQDLQDVLLYNTLVVVLSERVRAAWPPSTPADKSYRPVTDHIAECIISNVPSDVRSELLARGLQPTPLHSGDSSSIWSALKTAVRDWLNGELEDPASQALRPWHRRALAVLERRAGQLVP